jgi:transcriptional regulatory protein RtcR
MVNKGFSIDRFHLLYQKRDKKLAEDIASEIKCISPETKVQLDIVDSLAWDYPKVSQRLFDYVSKFSFDYHNENYYIHLTTGTDTVKNCWVLLITNNILRAGIIQSHNPKGTSNSKDTSVPAHTADQFGNSFDVHNPKKVHYTIVNTDEISSQFNLWKQERSIQNRTKNNIVKYQQIFTEIKQIVDEDKKSSRFLLLGETGTGKTKLVNEIAEYLNLKDKLIEVNCACLIRERAMGELCGYKKGAFTGACEDHNGKLRDADGGILFLDEIGELGLEEQAMLLKVLDGAKVDTLGAKNSEKK